MEPYATGCSSVSKRALINDDSEIFERNECTKSFEIGGSESANNVINCLIYWRLFDSFVLSLLQYISYRREIR